MGKPPIKSTKALLKAELDTKAKFALSTKGIEAALIDSINRIDPLELMAVASGSLVVYDIFKSTPELLAQAKSFVFTPPIAVTIPIITLIIERIWGKQALTDVQKTEFEKIKNEFDLVLLVKSFFISYILVKHSGQIIAGVGNITGFIAGFLGLKAV